jgi:hypothetical protein
MCYGGSRTVGVTWRGRRMLLPRALPGAFVSDIGTLRHFAAALILVAIEAERTLASRHPADFWVHGPTRRGHERP